MTALTLLTIFRVCEKKILFFFILEFKMTSRVWLCTYFIKDSKDERFDWSIPGFDKSIKGVAGQMEKCPTTNRLHWQFVVRFDKPCGPSAVGKKIGLPGTHAEKPQYGKVEYLKNYCHKDDTAIPNSRFEYGELEGKQGKRSDLDSIKDEIMEGRRVDDIALENPIIYHQYGRTLNKIEELALRKLFRSWMTAGVWLHGKTGAGKSHCAFTDYNPDTHFLWTDDNGWWDGYKGQETVIINDFRGEIKFNEILKLVDKWPHFVPQRGKQPFPFLAKKVIITSSRKPEDVYSHVLSDDENFAQFQRRFEVKQL